MFGERKTTRKHDPQQPSEQERIEHEMMHLPFRNWCRHCIKGRGREEDCRKSINEARQVPEIHLEYMFMGDEEERNTLTFWVAGERATRAVLSTVVPKRSTGDWTCRRLMTWLREIGLEFVDIIVKSDNEPVLTTLIESRSTLRAMKSGSRMIIETSPVGSSKGNGIVERATQSVQGIIKTMRSAIEEKCEVKIEVTHSVWLWIAEQAGFLLTRCEVGRGGKTAYERLKGNSAKVQGLSFAEGILRKKRRAGGPLGKLTCMWKDCVYLCIKATTGEVIVEELERRVAHKDGLEEDSDGKKGPKQSGDDRGFSDGERLK